MYGTRSASVLFGNYVIDVMLAAGCIKIGVVPMTFRHPQHDYTVGCHGDDFLGEGETRGLDELEKVMKDRKEREKHMET